MKEKINALHECLPNPPANFSINASATSALLIVKYVMKIVCMVEVESNDDDDERTEKTSLKMIIVRYVTKIIWWM